MENTPAPDTSNFLDWVEIKNFKSIKDLRLDCKRVNIFIGKPNVGKSNILEALGMLGAEYFRGKFVDGAVRYRKLNQLFYQNNSKSTLAILSNKLSAFLERNAVSEDQYQFILDKSTNQLGWDQINNYLDGVLFSDLDANKGFIGTYKSDGTFVLKTEMSRLGYGGPKKYDYLNDVISKDSAASYLLPHGSNLYDVIDRRADLKNEFGKMIAEQGLDLVLDQNNFSLSVQRKDGFYVYRFDYYTLADTFRRFMFYIAAIESNQNSVIVFEEPEVHSFPPYTQDIAYRMIYSETNQFFVSTHSPYLLQTLVENLNDEQVAVFVTYYENYETKVKRLSTEELNFVQEYSTDVFFNLDRFVPTSDAASVS